MLISLSEFVRTGTELSVSFFVISFTTQPVSFESADQITKVKNFDNLLKWVKSISFFNYEW